MHSVWEELLQHVRFLHSLFNIHHMAPAMCQAWLGRKNIKMNETFW